MRESYHSSESGHTGRYLKDANQYTLPQNVIYFSVCLIGGGFVVLPFITVILSVPVVIGGLLLLASTSYYTHTMMIEMAEDYNLTTFEDIGGAAFGIIGYHIAWLAQACFVMTSSVVSLTAAAKLIGYVIDRDVDYSTPRQGLVRLVVVVAMTSPSLLIMLFRVPRKMVFFHFLALCGALGTALLLLVMAFSELTSKSPETHTKCWMPSKSINSQYVESLMVLAFCFVGQHKALDAFNQLRLREESGRWGKVVYRSMVVVFAIYCIGAIASLVCNDGPQSLDTFCSNVSSHALFEVFLASTLSLIVPNDMQTLRRLLIRLLSRHGFSTPSSKTTSSTTPSSPTSPGHLACEEGSEEHQFERDSQLSAALLQEEVTIVPRSGCKSPSQDLVGTRNSKHQPHCSNPKFEHESIETAQCELDLEADILDGQIEGNEYERQSNLSLESGCDNNPEFQRPKRNIVSKIRKGVARKTGAHGFFSRSNSKSPASSEHKSAESIKVVGADLESSQIRSCSPEAPENNEQAPSKVTDRSQVSFPKQRPWTSKALLPPPLPAPNALREMKFNSTNDFTVQTNALTASWPNRFRGHSESLMGSTDYRLNGKKDVGAWAFTARLPQVRHSETDINKVEPYPNRGDRSTISSSFSNEDDSHSETFGFAEHLPSTVFVWCLVTVCTWRINYSSAFIIMTYVGAFGASLLSLVLPALFYFKLAPLSSDFSAIARFGTVGNQTKMTLVFVFGAAFIVTKLGLILGCTFVDSDWCFSAQEVTFDGAGTDDCF